MTSRFPYFPPIHRALSVVHLDEDLLVLSKPCGLLAVPGKYPEFFDCLESRAKAAFPGALLTHRLDRATSGIMVMAMNKRAQSHVSISFEKRRVEKLYVARVWGHIAEDAGRIELPLCADWPNRPKQRVDHENGKYSLTEWRVRSRDETNGVASTLVELAPHTGRSHQLRVHMLAIGHPILGDTLYAHEEAKKAACRLMLHAESIALPHPKDGKMATFTDPYFF